jgi:hypothetical protein
MKLKEKNYNAIQKHWDDNFLELLNRLGDHFTSTWPEEPFSFEDVLTENEALVLISKLAVSFDLTGSIVSENSKMVIGWQ